MYQVKEEQGNHDSHAKDNMKKQKQVLCAFLLVLKQSASTDNNKPPEKTGVSNKPITVIASMQGGTL